MGHDVLFRISLPPLPRCTYTSNDSMVDVICTRFWKIVVPTSRFTVARGEEQKPYGRRVLCGNLTFSSWHVRASFPALSTPRKISRKRPRRGPSAALPLLLLLQGDDSFSPPDGCTRMDQQVQRARAPSASALAPAQQQRLAINSSE